MINMDVDMETDQHTCLLIDEKALSSPKPVSCDQVCDDILQDKYFDHTRPLDSNALDALLNTKFNTNFDDVEDELPTSTIAAQWRPAHSESLPQQLSPSSAKLGLSSLHEKHRTRQPTQTGSQFTLCSPEAQVPMNFNSHPYVGHAPHNSYEQHNAAQQSHAPPFGHNHQGRYYSTLGPVAMPTMNDVYPELHAQPSHFGHYSPYSPSSASRQGTVDLMDSENAIPEEDEAGEVINGEIADPCYAQLLYRCLRDAPDHTMALKDVYKWVHQYSQKARDSAGTGWQNSVRHNLSMNAVSIHEPSISTSSHRS
jgi:hypothetical protein